MLVDCPDCEGSYHLAADEVGEQGRVVICPRCGARWFLAGSRPIEDVTARGADWAVASSQSADGGTKRRSGVASGWRKVRSAALVASIALAATVAVEGRARIVRAAPRAAGLYAVIGWPVNLRGLQFAHVEPQGVDPVEMTIAGTIRNVAHRRVHVPRLAFEVRDAAGVRLLGWSDHLPTGTIAAGRSLDFTSSVHRLPPSSRHVLVRFIDREDEAVASLD